ncbi:hypothetical protein [Gelidibacter japonicus]|uniref:hypothetical protein n=1 Tax=Gelidibacter japonicus TaxID=1962232 RepID=UPI0013D8764D|nr:hypothetical protein [Gelidibacter japonicus]
MKYLKKTVSVLAIVLFMGSTLNANVIYQPNVEDNLIQEVSCLRGAHSGARAFAIMFDLNYEQEYLLFDSLLEHCVLNGGW